MLTNNKLLMAWLRRFFFANIILLSLIETSYISVMPSLGAVAGANAANSSFAYLFLGLSFIAHATVINLILGGICCLLAFIIRNRYVIFGIAVTLATATAMAQIIDSLTYRLYYSHQFGMAITVLKSGAIGEELPLSNLEYTVLALICLVVIAIQIFIARFIWKKLLHSSGKSKLALRVTASLAVIVIASYTIMAFTVSVPQKYRFSSTQSHLLLKMARTVPYYADLYSLIIPTDTTQRLWDIDGKQVKLTNKEVNRPLNYPLQPLRCNPPQKKPNILFLVFDTLRHDALNKTVMPNMTEFSKQTINFSNVYSGGNCTQPGIFALFYGLPANYWLSTVEQKKGPVLISQLQKSGYQMGIFASASLLFPQFNKNVFVDVKNLKINTVGDTSIARDKRITKLFQNFVAQRNKSKPFFSFIFYDAVHNYCEGSQHANMKPFQPAIAQCARFSLTKNSDATPYVNRYNNAAHFLDQEAAKVIKTLKQQKLLDNTIIVITADHGEQHNDQKMGYWSHASAYTPYQLHIPMLVYWPGKPSTTHSYFATNFDVAPTIMQNVLNCSNPSSDYSVGTSLFNPKQRPYLIAGSYTDYAFIEQNKVTRIYPGGDYIINDKLGRHINRGTLDVDFIKQAQADLDRYFH